MRNTSWEREREREDQYAPGTRSKMTCVPSVSIREYKMTYSSRLYLNATVSTYWYWQGDGEDGVGGQRRRTVRTWRRRAAYKKEQIVHWERHSSVRCVTVQSAYQSSQAKLSLPPITPYLPITCWSWAQIGYLYFSSFFFFFFFFF